MKQQLILDFRSRNDKTFSNYVTGDNAALIEQLNTPEHNPFLFVSGAPSTGKTHLLCAACATTKHAALIPLEAKHISIEVLDGLDSLSLICLDNIHLIAGNAVWEEAVFHLYNRIKDAHQRLILSSRLPIPELSFQLQDLNSRVSSSLSYHILPLSDGNKVLALQQHARIHGIDLSTACSQYLVNHFTRDMASLLHLLNELDTASLSAKRKLTIPFIRAFTGRAQT